MPTYSHSQLSTYETCPHQYKLSYIDKIEAETEGIEAFMGSRVHEALEKLYRDLRVTKLNTLEEIVDFYHQGWEKNWNDVVQIVRSEYSAEDYRRLGVKCLTDYYRRYFPFDQGKTLGLEESIYFPLEEEGGYSIRGFIDRLTLTDGSVLEIHDYKTSSRLPSRGDVDSDRQLSLYQMGVEGKWKDVQEVRLVWHYLCYDTEIRSSRTPEQLRQVRRKTLELIQRIEADRDFAPRESPLCAWCDYQRLCPKRRHLVTVESLPPNEFLNQEGVALVNHYVGLKERKRLLTEEMDAEIAKVEEALFAYAQQEALEAIYGSDHVAKVRIEMKEKYPLKGDPGRKPLEEMIKKAGKWMEVSDLNPWMLARVLERGGWAPTLVRKVREFMTAEQNRSITVTRTKERE